MRRREALIGRMPAAGRIVEQSPRGECRATTSPHQACFAPTRRRGGVLILILALAHAVSQASERSVELKAVDAIDLARYAGSWFEVARLPNFFQRACVSDSRASYTLQADGAIGVVNECRRADGSMDRVTGTARRATATGPGSKLRVSFFWPFYGDYWVIDLDPAYRWAVVGEPGRRYLWILSREPQIDGATYQGILDRVRAQGYDLTGLRGPEQR